MDGINPGPFLTVEQLSQPWRGMVEPLSAHNAHPARAWFVGISIGVVEDDHSVRDLPATHAIYRFRRGNSAAYVWQTESGGVRPAVAADARAGKQCPRPRRRLGSGAR